MKARTFIIADTHFGHRNIIKYEPVKRPFATIEEHNMALVDKWNTVVHGNDTVWHLGDVLFGKDSFKYLPMLNGRKMLVMGNHDHYPSALYLEHFAKLHGAAELRGFILTHMPVHESQFERYEGNLHGHLHSKSMEDSRYFCVSAEHTWLCPMQIDEAIEILRVRVAVDRAKKERKNAQTVSDQGPTG